MSGLLCLAGCNCKWCSSASLSHSLYSPLSPLHPCSIPVGKLALYSALAGVDPHHTLPVTLDVGTDNEKLLSDPFYRGLREKRMTDVAAYDALIEEFVVSCQELYGKNVMIQWEDFGNSNAFRVLHRYALRCCSMNDDIQGTASVVVSGLITAARVTKVPLADQKFVFLGAGEAGVGIADLLAYAMALEKYHKGVIEASTPRSARATAFTAPGDSAEEKAAFSALLEEERKKIWLVDSKGLVVASRKSEAGFAHHKLPYAHEGQEPIADFKAVIEAIKPHAIVGVSTQPGAFSKGVVDTMAAINERPIIFALSNPTTKSECAAEQAVQWTDGRAVFASGSPFDTVSWTDKEGKARSYVPGQANNSYIFPACGLAATSCLMDRLDDHTMFAAALALSECVGEEDLATGCLFPPLSKIREVSAHIATAIAEDGYSRDICALPKPVDLAAHIKASMWSPSY